MNTVHRPPHHHRPPSPAGSVAPIIRWGIAGLLLGIALAVGLAGPWRPVGLVAATIAGISYGIVVSERISDSWAKQVEAARRRMGGR